MTKKQKLIVILGPTASGKSDLAVKIARKFNGEVVSADSRQVYKGLDIGTGKIIKGEMRGVKHHLLDVANPALRLSSGQAKRFSASDFIDLTNKTIVQIVNVGKVPIICGGTGFYIDALLGDKQIPEVPPNEKLRKELEKKSTEELFKILKKLDPERANNIDAKNPRRLMRAIEICKVLGRVPKFESRTQNLESRKYRVLKIGISIEEKELKERINKRIEKWFKQGLLKEVSNLHKKGLSWKRMSEIGLEYKLVANFLKSNKVSKAPFDTLQLKKKMGEKTWQYAKRQMTWFKRDKNIRWFTPSKVKGALPSQISKIEKEVRKFLKFS
ncbi:MAG: tRNA dimethylallyltransferase [Parcubacteria group bacterium GW2011_GWA1_47_10]|nr:MAG: tRNA dimethylallyltransferase [Parcubacteria group bacterium GW2011_GWA1_47_10]